MTFQESYEKRVGRRQFAYTYSRQLFRTVRFLKEHGVESVTKKADADQINKALESIPNTSSRQNYRRSVRTLLREMDTAVAERIAVRLLRVKVRFPPPVSYTVEQVAALFAAADAMEGNFKASRCPVNLFLGGFLRVLYETGFRFSDVLNLKKESVLGDRVSITMSKTGDNIQKILTPETAELVRRVSLLSPGDRVFGWACTQRWLLYWTRKVWKNAGLPGTPKWLRRTAATLVEMQQPGAATLFLGHRSPGLAQRHYLDMTMLRSRCPRPPPIALRLSAGS